MPTFFVAGTRAFTVADDGSAPVGVPWSLEAEFACVQHVEIMRLASFEMGTGYMPRWRPFTFVFGPGAAGEKVYTAR